jgi:hypothetical protein
MVMSYITDIDCFDILLSSTTSQTNAGMRGQQVGRNVATIVLYSNGFRMGDTDESPFYASSDAQNKQFLDDLRQGYDDCDGS